MKDRFLSRLLVKAGLLSSSRHERLVPRRTVNVNKIPRIYSLHPRVWCVSAVRRLIKGAGSAVHDPLVRRGYIARLKWLAGGASLQAWSLVYRRGLSGRFDPQVLRSSEEVEQVYRCPPDCGADAPLSHLYERRYTYVLANTVVNTFSGATLLCTAVEQSFFVRESISWPFESILSHGLDTPEPDGASQRIQGPATVFASNTNDYHWLVEELPLVLRIHEELSSTTLIVNETGRTQKHEIVANHLGMKLMSAPRTTSITEHVMPGRANDSWFIHPQDYLRLAEFGRSLTKNTNGLKHDRVYVSRRYSPRSIPQEGALEDLLRVQGFFIAHLENMTWSDQISLFENARVVVGPHGAGLSNLIFTRPGATVVELTNGFHYNRCFEWITHIADHAYIKVDANAQLAPIGADQLANDILSKV